MRKLVFGILALAIVLGSQSESSAQKKKKKLDAPISGKVFSVDADQGFIRLIVTTRNKKETSTTDPQFKIDDDTKVIVNGKESMGKAALKDVKKDDQATVIVDKDFKTVSVTIGGARKKK